MPSKATLGTAVMALGFVIGSVGCATIDRTKEKVASQRQEMKESLCDFDGERPATLITHLDNRGGTVAGDVRQEQLIKERVWASALATTKQPVATITTTSTSIRVVPQCNYFGQCIWVPVPFRNEDTEVKSLEDIYGLGRVPVEGSRLADRALRAAADLAKENCESMATDFAERTPGISKYNSDLNCIVLDKQICR